ncbi:MAG: 2Fe-2S iron-sulfur cluster-binding protein, partial [Nitrospirota bacterium]
METRLAECSKTEIQARKKVKVTFLPQDIIAEGEEGKSILEIALEHEIELNHNCGGNCACTTCHVIIRNGMDNLSEAEDEENDMLDKAVG